VLPGAVGAGLGLRGGLGFRTRGLQLRRHRTGGLLPARGTRLCLRLRLGLFLFARGPGFDVRQVIEVRGETRVLDRSIFLTIFEQQLGGTPIPSRCFGELTLVAVVLGVRDRATRFFVGQLVVSGSARHGARW
jgi:hypothetical protein